MADKFDLAVIGGGPGGYVAAIRGAQLGRRVVLFEKEQVGGTCLHRGCIPTKTLLASGKALDAIRSASRYGIRLDAEPEVDMPAMQDRKNKVIDIQRKGIEGLLKANGVELVVGRARLEAADLISVLDAEAGTREIAAEKVILAAGSRPVEIGGLKYDGERILSSDHALSLMHVPASVLIVGAGVIGCEFAMMFSSFGARVEMVELVDRALSTEDEEISKLFERELKKRKIKLRTGVKVAGATAGPDGAKTELEGGEVIETEIVLVSIGRAPQSADLFPEGLIGVDARGFITVDETLHTSVDSVFAIGDINGSRMLAHVASNQGIVGAENAFGAERRFDLSAVPGAIYTHPEIGSIGLTEAAAKSAGIETAIGRYQFRALGRAHAAGEIDGMVKLVADKNRDGLLVGAHIIGAGASDLIHIAAGAIGRGETAEQLGRAIYAHPTFAEAIGEAAEDVGGTAIHVPPAKK